MSLLPQPRPRSDTSRRYRWPQAASTAAAPSRLIRSVPADEADAVGRLDTGIGNSAADGGRLRTPDSGDLFAAAGRFNVRGALAPL